MGQLLRIPSEYGTAYDPKIEHETKRADVVSIKTPHKVIKKSNIEVREAFRSASGVIQKVVLGGFKSFQRLQAASQAFRLTSGKFQGVSDRVQDVSGRFWRLQRVQKLSEEIQRVSQVSG